MHNTIHHEKLVLASQSPRRRYLLEQAGLNFDVIPSRFDENQVSRADPREQVRILAEAKAEEVAGAHPEAWVIGADTLVLIDGEVLGKPRSVEEARSMLNRLSGTVHQVLTGYAVRCREKDHLFSDVVATDVHFKALSEDEVEWYIHTDEPFDKAGAYAIQGLGTFLVRRIQGSYTNVVGLPVCEVIEYLIRIGVVQYRIDEETSRPALDRSMGG